MISNKSKRAAGIGAAACIAGATAGTWFAVNHDSSTTAGAPVEPVPHVVTVSPSAPRFMHPMPNPHVVESHRRRAVSHAAGPAHWLSPARIRAIAAHAAGGRVEDIGPGDNPNRMTYDVSVVRVDGTDVTVVVDARSGAVLSADWRGQDPANPPDNTGGD